jgi:hypothetical protein
MYCVDTNIFIDWWSRLYPPDVFPTLVQNVEELARAGRIAAPDSVYIEIGRVGSPPLRAWAKSQRGIFRPHNSELQAETANIVKSYRQLIDSESFHEEADPFLIALAKINKWTVVTHETSAKLKKHPKRSLYIPDVCIKEEIPCITLVEMMRREKWRF